MRDAITLNASVNFRLLTASGCFLQGLLFRASTERAVRNIPMTITER